MNKTAFSVAGRDVYANSVVIMAGVLLCFLITYALYSKRSRSRTAVLMFFPIAFVLSIIIGRFIHWYFTGLMYSGFAQAFTDFSVGSIALPGAIIGTWIAAVIVEKLGYCSRGGRLLDCAAPGICLLIALIRFSALFTDTCRGKTEITYKFLQILPIASPMTDAAGNVTYRFATFFVEFLLMLFVTYIVFMFYKDFAREKLMYPCSSSGNVWRRMLVVYAAVEIVMDSTRRDSLLMHFRFLHSLNAYSAFISFAQVFAVLCILYVFIYYLRGSVAANGFSAIHAAAIVLIIISIVGIGYFGEYSIQRYGHKLSGYIIMISSCILVQWLVANQFESCIEYRSLEE